MPRYNQPARESGIETGCTGRRLERRYGRYERPVPRGRKLRVRELVRAQSTDGNLATHDVVPSL
jgi:hypothetical protein